MPNCDICGKDRPLVRAIIENASLDVCSECGDYGDVIKEKRFVDLDRKPRFEVMELIVPDYSERIRNKRISLGLTQKEIGLKLNEKESIIHSIENGRLEPDLNLARKLERCLGLKLVVVHENDSSNRVNIKDKNLTIGDLIKLKDE